MKALFGILLILSAGGLIAYEKLQLNYWLTPPQVRAANKWNAEVNKITAKSAKLKTALLLLSDIQMTTTDQQFKDMIDTTQKPFKKVKNGSYLLKIQIMPWIEDMKYGYLIQHELFDSSNNKVNEFNINVDIGKLW